MPEGLTPVRFVLQEIADGDNIVAHAPGGVSKDWHEGGWGPERTHYAAVRHQRGYVFGVVIRYRMKYCSNRAFEPKYREIWWRIIDESEGPTAYDMPARVFCRLSPLEDLGESPDGYAGQWRAETARRIAETAARPKVRVGDTVVFDEPIEFADDTSHQDLVFEGRDRFRCGWRHYRVPGWRKMAFRVAGCGVT
jgi:hypothetical protein